MSISLLIIVVECAPGQLVCITPVQLAAKLQSGLIVSMRLKLADIYTSCVLGFYSDLVEITSLLCFFLDFFFFLFGTTRLFHSVSRLFLFKKTLFTVFFFKKQHQPLWLCPMVSLTVHWIVWVLSSYYYYHHYHYYYYYYFYYYCCYYCYYCYYCYDLRKYDVVRWLTSWYSICVLLPRPLLFLPDRNECT